MYSNKILSPAYDDAGYLNITLHTLHTKETCKRNQVTIRVNRLVLLTFCPIDNCENLLVNHINGVKDDNHLWNLEWVTPRSNTIHAIETGLMKIQDINGEKNPMSKLSENKVLEIAELIRSGLYSFKEISNMYQISVTVIESIAHDKSWKHLNLNLNNDIRVSSSFSDQELDDICRFFESNPINDKLIYPSEVEIFRDCFRELKLYSKYDLETKRKTMSRILHKSRKAHDKITQKYDYNFIK